MAGFSESFDSSEQAAFYEWLETLDLDIPLSELIDNPAWLEPPSFEPEELAHLDEVAREYAQELLSRESFPDVPTLDADDLLLAQQPEQELAPDKTFDLDVDMDR